MEIMGQNLDVAFKDLGIQATMTHKTPPQGYESELEVWEMSKSEFEKLCAIKEDEWKYDLSWFRSGECIYGGSATVEYIVNGNTMLGYEPEKPFDAEDDFAFKREHNCYTDWLSEVMDLGTAKNVVIFATSLAKDNGLTLAEFMKKYQG